MLEKTLKSPLDCKKIKPIHPKGNQSWICIGRADAETETSILWPLDAKNWLIGKDPNAGKDWGQEEKGTTEGEMVGWHHWLDGYEFEQALGVGDGPGSLACCSPWSRKELDITEQLNWGNNNSACKDQKEEIPLLVQGTLKYSLCLGVRIWEDWITSSQIMLWVPYWGASSIMW